MKFESRVEIRDAMNRNVRKTITDNKTGTSWNFTRAPEDFNLTHTTTLLSSKFNDLLEKIGTDFQREMP